MAPSYHVSLSLLYVGLLACSWGLARLGFEKVRLKVRALFFVFNRRTTPQLNTASGLLTTAAPHSSPPVPACLAQMAALPPNPSADPELNSISEKLNSDPDLADIKRRPVGGGKQAAYIPGDKVISIANDTFGFHRWSSEIRKIEVDFAVQDAAKKWNVGVYCVMRVNFLAQSGAVLSFHEDLGFGAATNQPHFNDAIENARKGAVTDARKRALRVFGPALGSGVSGEDFQKQVQEYQNEARRQAAMANAASHAAAAAAAAASSSSSAGAGAGAGGAGRSGFSATSVPVVQTATPQIGQQPPQQAIAGANSISGTSVVRASTNSGSNSSVGASTTGAVSAGGVNRYGIPNSTMAAMGLVVAPPPQSAASSSTSAVATAPVTPAAPAHAGPSLLDDDMAGWSQLPLDNNCAAPAVPAQAPVPAAGSAGSAVDSRQFDSRSSSSSSSAIGGPQGATPTGRASHNQHNQQQRAVSAFEAASHHSPASAVAAAAGLQSAVTGLAVHAYAHAAGGGGVGGGGGGDGMQTDTNNLSGGGGRGGGGGSMGSIPASILDGDDGFDDYAVTVGRDGSVLPAGAANGGASSSGSKLAYGSSSDSGGSGNGTHAWPASAPPSAVAVAPAPQLPSLYNSFSSSAPISSSAPDGAAGVPAVASHGYTNSGSSGSGSNSTSRLGGMGTSSALAGTGRPGSAPHVPITGSLATTIAAAAIAGNNTHNSNSYGSRSGGAVGAPPQGQQAPPPPAQQQQRAGTASPAHASSYAPRPLVGGPMAAAQQQQPMQPQGQPQAQLSAAEIESRKRRIEESRRQAEERLIARERQGVHSANHNSSNAAMAANAATRSASAPQPQQQYGHGGSSSYGYGAAPGPAGYGAGGNGYGQGPAR